MSAVTITLIAKWYKDLRIARRAFTCYNPDNEKGHAMFQEDVCDALDVNMVLMICTL